MNQRPTPSGLLFVVLALFGLMAMPASAGVPDSNSPHFGVYVMRKIDDQYRREKSQGIMQMHIKTQHWERTLSLEAWSLGKEYTLVQILSPRKERGTATLKAKNDLYTYLNKTGRTIKITSGMMGGSWMGSHFTNDDLVRQSRLSRDYHIKKTFEGNESGTNIYRFVLTPKADAPVVWGKVVVSVRQADLEPLRQIFYDEDGLQVRELTFSDHRNVDGRIVPMNMVMRPLDGSGEFTRITWQKLDFGVNLKESFFSLQRLKSLRRDR